ncbi:IclR family transcriptional regulator [Paracoccus pacificus]|uniref:IclR family transcriptional regulator n=1 Tax=Paracoccus pacificus TaxID=1463598 RepID=A0ABW4R9I1_9RHOB
MGKEVDYRSNSLVRGLSILQCFDHRRPEMTLTEIAEAISVTSSAAYRFVVTLEREGYLTRQENRYRLAPRVMDLGYRYLSSLDVYEIARGPAEQLRNDTGLSAHVAVLEGVEIIYIYRALSDSSMVSNVPVGTRLPAALTTMGRVLLSDLPPAEIARRFADYAFTSLIPDAPKSLAALQRLLPDDRARGYVAQPSHLASGTYSIAAPLVSRHGKYVGAVNLSAHEMQIREPAALTEKLLDTARTISKML